jgi:hypothetical protein
MTNIMNKEDKSEKRSPPDIFRAAQNDDVFELQAALKAGQRLDEQRRDLVGMTPVHLACVFSSNNFLTAAASDESFNAWIRDNNLRVPFDHASAKNNLKAKIILFKAMYPDEPLP